MPPSVSIFALTTHGLEPVSARELTALPGMTVTQIAYRRIAATYNGPLEPLLALRTVDDVFLDVATWRDIGHTRDALIHLRALGTRLDLRAAHAACSCIRPLRIAPSFSTTASFVGRRNYSAPEIKTAVGKSIVRTHGWRYCEDDRHADLNIRIFIAHDHAVVGVRLAAAPLHERAWLTMRRRGALKPSVAAALVMRAGAERGMRVLDPCCGTGTIVIEAALRGATALGGDITPGAIQAARTHVARAGIAARFQVLDAQRLPFTDGAFDRVICNLPWGRQVSAGLAPNAFYQRSLAEMPRVLVPGGRIVLLTAMPHLVRYPDLRCLQQLGISLHGQRPSILVCAR